MNIPLDTFLKAVDVVEVTEDNADQLPDDLAVGCCYLHFDFATQENDQTDIYIDVTELNNIKGSTTDSIRIDVTNNQTISAHIQEGAITLNKLNDEVKNYYSVNINSKDGVTTIKQGDKALGSIEYKSDTKTLKLL